MSKNKEWESQNSSGTSTLNGSQRFATSEENAHIHNQGYFILIA